jgi:Xaa-Pro aminopeptidase
LMKSDLDRLMAARDLQAIFVTGDAENNPPRDYLTGGAHITGGLVIKKRGEAPVMVVNPMEIEEAAKSGLAVFTYNDLGWAELIEQAEGSRSKAEVALWGRCLERFSIPPGKIGLYGAGSLNHYLAFTPLLEAGNPGYQIVGEMGLTLFDEAYITKDADEIRRIKMVAAATSAVLQATWDFIAAHRANGDMVVKDDGAPLTIGEVKRFIRRALLDHELEDTGMIFAQGRDAGFPHSRGENEMPLRVGQAIVFDLFPRQLGGGYHHDTTRTWCIGHAPEAVRQAYDTVMAAFRVALDAYAEPGQPAHALQDAVLDYFEANGHPTPRSHPGTSEGYVHSLGHGVGLNIHERPSLHHLVKDDLLQIGNMITIEPGLYYPERGFGVRVEDSFIIDETGALVSLTDFHKQLVLPLAGQG